MKQHSVYAWAWGVPILSVLLLLMFITPAIPQPQKYHDFADKRELYGIPNTLNVVSNFPLLVIGVLGLVFLYYKNYFKFSLQGEPWGWTCFFTAVAAAGFGSAYYHLHPNDARLVWDRLPMAIAFMSLTAILIIERIDEKKGTFSIIPLLLTGTTSVFYWRLFDDIRPYVLAQFVPCVAIILMAIMLPPMYTHSMYWIWAAGFYQLAMVGDAMDKVIYKLTLHIVSGHTLKHLSAAMVPVLLTLMLVNRRIEPNRISLLERLRDSGKKVQ